jgi:hypothetical protein
MKNMVLNVIGLLKFRLPLKVLTTFGFRTSLTRDKENESPQIWSEIPHFAAQPFIS